jgi:predicted alpha/beta-hydrolase family hydrolase
MAPKFLIDEPKRPGHTILLAHGAGAAMDSPAMTAITGHLVEAGFGVARFEFAYMASRRTPAGRKPPPRGEALLPEYLAAVDALKAKGLLIIGGKSMGGRVASMVADQLHSAGRVAGLLCLGYPFHPVGKPTQLRTAHLANLKTPTLIVQGTRDPFGTPDEVATYRLAKAIRILWLEDGDHDLRPRKSVSGFSVADHLKRMAEETAAWASKITA